MTHHVRKPVFVFLGHSGAGKDAACMHLAAHTSLKFARSMSWHLAPYCAAALGLPVETFRGPERHRYAEQMFQIGERLRAADPGCLVRAALADGQLLAGLRDPAEVDYARDHGLVDLVCWVERDVPTDPTMRRFGARPRDWADIVIDNTGTLAALHGRLERLARACGLAWH